MAAEERESTLKLVKEIQDFPVIGDVHSDGGHTQMGRTLTRIQR